MKKLLVFFLMLFCLTLNAQRYVSDSFFVGSQDKTLEWKHSLETKTYIDVIDSLNIIIIDTDFYLILSETMMESCKEITAVKKTGEFQDYVYNIEICSFDNGTTNIIVEIDKISLLFVCREIKIKL